MERNPFGGLTDREATLIMAALSRNNPILPIKAIDEKDLRTRFLITAWLLAEERQRPNFLAGALLKINSVGGYIPNIQHLNWIVRNAYRTGSGNPDFRDNGGRVLEILWKMEWVVRKGSDFYDNKACFFIDYHNLNFIGVLVRVIEKWLNEDEEQDGDKTISDINQVFDHNLDKVQFEPHYPLPRFNRKADRLLVEQCGEAYELLMPASREAIIDNIRWHCPTGKDVYAAVESGNIQFRMERKAQNVRWVEVEFDDVKYSFDLEVETNF